MALSDRDLAMSVLEHMDIAILRRTGPMQYSFFGNAPLFYDELFKAEDGNRDEPWLRSSMLDFFITDAESFFERGIDGEITSGIWQEESVDKDRALLASALLVRGECLLILRCLQEDYIERVRILQKAREQLLEQRKLSSNLEEYKRKARYDALTGLCNRATLMEALEAEVWRCNEAGSTFSFLLLDIDNFKQVNDTYGHLVGDSVLSQLGTILSTDMRREDMAARYGGEELVVLISNTGRDQAYLTAESLRKRIEEHDFNIPRAITVSIGCTSYEFGEAINTLIERADIALYEAKRRSKNVVVVR